MGAGSMKIILGLERKNFRCFLTIFMSLIFFNMTPGGALANDSAGPVLIDGVLDLANWNMRDPVYFKVRHVQVCFLITLPGGNFELMD